MTNLERLQELDNDTLQDFLKKRNSRFIPEDLQRYILMMNAAQVLLREIGQSQTKVCQSLQESFPELSYRKARKIYEDAMNFFYVDDDISAVVWDNHYADKMESLADEAIKLERPDVALKAMEKAHELRTRNRDAIKPQDWTPPVFIISGKVSPEQLGYAKQDVYEVQRRKEDRMLSGLITELPTTEKEKARLLKEAGIETVEPIEHTPEDDDTTE